jgi:serine phosphatase RsbU (regulator of sigma subunit)
VVLGVGSAFVLGPPVGLVLTIVAVILGVWIIGQSAVATPLVWLPVSILAGLAGERVRRGDELRRELLVSLRQGLESLVSDPDVPSLQVVSRYVPAERAQVLAGDFYGVIPQPGGRVAVMVGDVAGHGPGAAAVATRLRAAWRGLASADVAPQETIRVLNELLIAERIRHATPITFATMSLVSIDAEQATASVLLAGHPPPIVIGPEGAAECGVAPNPAIGVYEPAAWRGHEIDLPAPPWTIVLYTDGLVEGRSDPAGPRPFGIERLLALFAARTPPLGEADADAIVAAIREANGGPLADDMLLLTASSAGPG